VIAYLDSSAILKSYLLHEAGRGALELMLESPVDLAASRFTYVEVRAALAAARRAGRLSRSEHDRAVDSFDVEWRNYSIVELDEPVGRRAGSIAETFGLRAGDAVQLASVLELDRDTTVIVAWDLQLRAAASAAGVPVYPPVI
jgi:predicted nucleic acid-binding protein